MLYGAEFAVCSQINTKETTALWAECIIVKRLALELDI